MFTEDRSNAAEIAEENPGVVRKVGCVEALAALYRNGAGCKRRVWSRPSLCVPPYRAHRSVEPLREKYFFCRLNTMIQADMVAVCRHTI